MANRLRVLVVGAGHMGSSHAYAYAKIPEFEIVGIVARSAASTSPRIAAIVAA